MSDVFRIQGQATIFGSEYSLNRRGQLQRDPGDNSIGFYTDPKTGKPYDTFSKTLEGASLPIPIIDQTIGSHGSASVREAIERGDWTVVATGANGKTVTMAIVDIGPATWTHHVLDLTWGPAHQLAIGGLGPVDYEIHYRGQPVPIKGWQVAGGSPGPKSSQQHA